MNSPGVQRQKRKLTLPSLQNLVILDSPDAPLSPKGPKSPKLCLSKGSANRRRCPTCIICQDDLIVSDEEPGGESVDRPILILKCGHAFHTGCINNWFMTNKEKEFKTCPICRKEMRSNDTRRVFLVFGEE